MARIPTIQTAMGPPETPQMQQTARWGSPAPDSPNSPDSPLSPLSPVTPNSPPLRSALLDPQVTIVGQDSPQLAGRLSRAASVKRQSSLRQQRKVGELAVGPEIGQGAFCRTHQAYGPQGIFAVKLRLPSTEPSLFANEHAVLAKLHAKRLPHVVQFYPELGDGTDSLVFGLYGTNLAQYVRSPKFNVALEDMDFFDFSRMTQPVVGMERWLRWARQLASGLSAIHGENIVHADFKPDNVLMADDDCYIADFSGAIDLDANPASQLAREIVAGIAWSPVFTDPLVRTGERLPSFGSDVYALGLVLAFCATGLEPYSEAKNPTQRLMWMDKIAPLDSYEHESRQKLERVQPIIQMCLQRQSLEDITRRVDEMIAVQ